MADEPACEEGFAPIIDSLDEVIRERDEARAEAARLREALADALNHEYAGELKAAHDEVARLNAETPWGANNETKDEWFYRQREKVAVIKKERDVARASRDFYAKELDAERAEVARLKDELASVTDAVNALHAYVQGERHDPAEVADLLNATTKGTQQ